MDFSSDNTVGVSEPILAALCAVNHGSSPAYGADAMSTKASQRLAEVFETDLSAFLVSTGTAANALSLAALSPPWGGIFCHAEAHIAADECGAPEMFTSGAKLLGIPGDGGKIGLPDFKAGLRDFPKGAINQVQPAALSLSQTTECGTLYHRAEIASLASCAHAAGLHVHMDGARFANALAAANCTPAEMSWKAGVDVLSFGATKNGALACEAVIFFNSSLAENFKFQRKRSGHTISKGRFLGSQMIAYLENDHWLALARTANARAAEFAKRLSQVKGIRLVWPCEANELFVIMPDKIDQALKAAGALYYDWSSKSLGNVTAAQENEVFVRLITSFATEPEAIRQFIAIARAATE
jgi:threonine aldolase